MIALIRAVLAPPDSTTPERAARLFLLFSYLGVLFFFSSIPSGDLHSDVDDRLSHAFAYGLLGVLLQIADAGFRRRPRLSREAGLIVFGILWGISDEWHQSFVPGRDVSLSDIVFDAVGVAAGVALTGILARRLR